MGKGEEGSSDFRIKFRNNYKTMIAGKTDARLIFGFAF